MTVRSLITVLALLVSGSVDARSYLSLEDALKSAMPGHEYKREAMYLSDKEMASVNESLKSAGIDRKFDDGLFVRYSYFKDGKVKAYSYTDTARQRSKPQSVLITIDLNGAVKKVTLLRNLEPAKYHPKDKWLDQFKEKSNYKNLKLNGSITAITGATMTSRATVKSVRKVMVIHSHFTKQVTSR
jgi:Na+-translocating ferredoxin:NAD+ oxidoreductase RnfG subunit